MYIYKGWEIERLDICMLCRGYFSAEIGWLIEGSISHHDSVCLFVCLLVLFIMFITSHLLLSFVLLTHVENFENFECDIKFLAIVKFSFKKIPWWISYMNVNGFFTLELEHHILPNCIVLTTKEKKNRLKKERQRKSNSNWKKTILCITTDDEIETQLIGIRLAGWLVGWLTPTSFSCSIVRNTHP